MRRRGLRRICERGNVSDYFPGHAEGSRKGRRGLRAIRRMVPIFRDHTDEIGKRRVVHMLFVEFERDVERMCAMVEEDRQRWARVAESGNCEGGLRRDQ